MWDVRFFERKLRKATNTLISGPVGVVDSKKTRKLCRMRFRRNMWSHLAYKLTKVNRKSSPRKSSESQMARTVELGWEIRVKLLVKLKIIRFTGNMQEEPRSSPRKPYSWSWVGNRMIVKDWRPPTSYIDPKLNSYSARWILLHPTSILPIDPTYCMKGNKHHSILLWYMKVFPVCLL